MFILKVFNGVQAAVRGSENRRRVFTKDGQTQGRELGNGLKT